IAIKLYKSLGKYVAMSGFIIQRLSQYGDHLLSELCLNATFSNTLICSSSDLIPLQHLAKHHLLNWDCLQGNIYNESLTLYYVPSQYKYFSCNR
uniref:Uncharacterized protein n=1 Tax=Oryzias latipes TaxID=8090 RepID=A0A3P9J2S6_ORYLA